MPAVTVALSTLNLLSAVGAFVAAYFWYRSATLRVLYDPTKDNGSAGIIIDEGGKHYDFFTTGVARDAASRKGAMFAAIAALLQGIALAYGGLVA
ncbi:hypothetical protein [Lysobacter solisilvae (ex Woo and Kim 2020)]|uniref:DUF3592 domain-containing protein n=1 Tax=Agrilutibacter terrestris TaxID=2865112 RepID=A0A7H0FVX7_9GAMM|nr:hypothetical protein [Lysobacter terrestris]QNP40193.1 hypothetical protein H8B22_11950 [Lysobacter terrestris]